MQIDFKLFDRAFLMPLSDDYRIAFMHPSDFLRLAPPIASRIPSQERRDAIGAILDDNRPLESFPVLEIEIDSDGRSAYVVNHDGRHRALELLSRNVRTIPVLIEFTQGKADDLPGVLRLYPQDHDEDDDYPGHDEESLTEKAEAVGVDRLGQIVKPSKLIKMVRLQDLDARLARMSAGALSVAECRTLAQDVIRNHESEESLAMLCAAYRDLTARTLRTPQCHPDHVREIHNLALAIHANLHDEWKTRIKILSEMLYEQIGMIETDSQHMQLATFPPSSKEP